MNKNRELFKQFKALGDETRFKIFSLLLDHDICVRGISYKLEISEASASQHLKILRACGLVRGEKRGYWVHYSVNQEAIKALIEALGDFLKAEKRKKIQQPDKKTRPPCTVKQKIKCPDPQGEEAKK
jgi:ArsR family transcriptional regulator